MTQYFEVLDRDGAARLGEFRLDSPVTTPALLDDVLVDGGSLWAAERELPTGSTDAVTILPHRSFPAGTRSPVKDAFAVQPPSVDFPSAVVVTADTAADHDADAYVLSDVRSFDGHAAALKDAIVELKASIPADTAVVVSGIATPANVATLAYVGIDGFDATRSIAKGTQGKYLTTDGEAFLEDLTELPCACPACQGSPAAFTREDCAAHNVNALRAELRRVRERIRSGRLRDYVEGQARHEQWLTATLREFDQQYGYLEERTPVVRDVELAATTEDSLRRVEIQRFADRVTTRYRNRFSNPIVLLPCSATKPYSDSQSHKQFYRAIDFRAHVVSMTSPIGVVPTELELTYPAQHYDTVVTGRWSADEKGFVASVLQRYLERNEYPRVVAHVPDEGYRDICERVEKALDLDFEYTVDEHPTTEASLSNLAAALEGELKYAKREREHNTVRAIADYQFGPDAGDALFEGVDIHTTGRLPKLQVRADDSTQLATMVPQYGTLAFTIAGAKQWVESAAPTKRVRIDEFVPHGSVLAPGVVDADDTIRPGDEVVIEGPKAFGVGRAVMSGPEMRASTRGIASEVRHVEER
ncbi:MAG: archaeosine synthase subunit alpha [Halobacteriota archaeon]